MQFPSYGEYRLGAVGRAARQATAAEIESQIITDDRFDEGWPRLSDRTTDLSGSDALFLTQLLDMGGWHVLTAGCDMVVLGNRSPYVVKIMKHPEAVHAALTSWGVVGDPARAVDRVERTARSIDIARRRVPDETALLFAHLAPGSGLDARIALSNGLSLDADHTAFVVQRRVDHVLCDALVGFRSNRLVGGAGARRAVDRWLAFNRRLWAKGVADGVGQFDLNYGEGPVPRQLPTGRRSNRDDGKPSMGAEDMVMIELGELVEGFDAVGEVLRRMPPLDSEAAKNLQKPTVQRVAPPGLLDYLEAQIRTTFEDGLARLQPDGTVPLMRVVGLSGPDAIGR